MKYVVVTVMKNKQMQGSWNTVIIVFQHKWCFHLVLEHSGTNNNKIYLFIYLFQYPHSPAPSEVGTLV